MKDNTLQPFLVTYERALFTADIDLAGHELAFEDIGGDLILEKTSGLNWRFVKAWVVEDDGQDGDDRRMFVSLQFRVQAGNMDDSDIFGDGDAALTDLADYVLQEYDFHYDGGWSHSDVQDDDE